MRLCSLSSGSSGNCVYVGSEQAHVLIDVGVSKKRVIDELRDIDLKPEDLDAIMITHEHVDHINGLGVFTRKYPIDVYGTPRTIQAIKENLNMGNLSGANFIPVLADTTFQIKDLTIETSQILHDAADPVCYTVTSGTKKAAICTDLGDYTDYLVEKLANSDILFIEANHDENMLMVGPYSFSLKQRILSNHGHLSNERSGSFILSLLNSHIGGIQLGHLSKENNFPELAYETVVQMLAGNSYTKDVRDFRLSVAPRDRHSELLEV